MSRKQGKLDHNPWCACAACRPRRAPETATGSLLAEQSKPENYSPERGAGVTDEMIVVYVRRQIKLMTDTVRKVARKYMASAKEAAAAKKGEGAQLLRGEHIPKKMHSGFDMHITEVREAPTDWTGIFVIEFKPIKGLPNADDGKPFSAWAANKSNTKIIAELLGDDTEDWKGKKIRLVTVFTRNPQSNKIVPSLAVIDK